MALLVPFVFGALLFAVSFDVQQSNHQFANSFSGRKLKELGGYEYGLIVFEQVSLVSNATTKWVKNELPVYLNISAEFVKPWVRSAKDFSLISFNIGCQAFNKISTFITDKYPVAEYWVQQNLPVVRESFYSFWNVTTHGANVAYDVAKSTGIVAAEYINENRWFDWAELQKYTQTAFDTTQTFASDTFSWAYSTIQSYTNQKR